MDENHKIHCITKVPVFNHLSTDEMRVIARVASSREYQKGEMVFFTGSGARILYIIHQGLMKQVRVARSGREQMVRTLHPGEFVGELALFSNRESEGYLEALKPSEVCQIHGRDVQSLLREFPEIATKIVEQLSNRLAGAEETIEQLGVHTVKQRLAGFLLRSLNKEGASVEPSHITLPFSKRDLASKLGTSQETLSRRLAELEEQGVITLAGQREITIHTEEALESIVAGEE